MCVRRWIQQRNQKADFPRASMQSSQRGRFRASLKHVRLRISLNRPISRDRSPASKKVKILNASRCRRRPSIRKRNGGKRERPCLLSLTNFPRFPSGETPFPVSVAWIESCVARSKGHHSFSEAARVLLETAERDEEKGSDDEHGKKGQDGKKREKRPQQTRPGV